jgi:nondiscriminating aspartyl-tRNA synthetase
MERIVSTDLPKHEGKKVLVKGWLHNLRELGKINFLILRDRGGLTQIVIEDKDEMAKLKGMQTGTVLSIEAKVQSTKNTELGVELVDPKITVVVPVTDVSPIDITKQELNVDIDTALDYRPVVLRHPKEAAVFKIQAHIMQAYAESMRSQGFTEFRTPLLMPSASESGADVFEVKYFDGKAYLAQSPQIHKQIMTAVFERVFTIATIFRAEKHNTSRHLMEVTQMDGEMAFIDSYQDVLEVVEQVVRDILAHLEKYCAKELALWDAKLPQLPNGRFPQVKIRQALEIIEKRLGKSAKRDELDLDPEDEREIGKWALEEHGSDFIWLLNFKKDKNFYTWNNPEDENESLSYDLACRGLEWLSGTHRINIYQTLLERMEKIGLKPEQYEHYLQAFKYGMPAEAGFSFGLERMTKQILGMENIREATLFPSDLKRISGTKIQREVLRGGEAVRNAILNLLKARAVKFEHAEHEETPTSEDAARVRGISLEEGVKALILVGKSTGNNFMVAIPGDKKANIKAVEEVVGERLEMEKPDKINEKFGLQIGGVPPFGNLLHIPVYMDKGVLDHKQVSFNAGLRTESVTMPSKDLAEVVEAEIGDFAQ